MKLQSALTVTSYEKFHQFVKAFAKGNIPLLMIIGDPGVSKSQSVRRAVKGEVCWIEGQASAFMMYGELYRHRNRPVVIDDVDALYADDAARRLLKSLCQTDIEKEISWKTRSKYLEEQKIPTTFRTKSKVCIIANEWRSLNTDVKAIEDRAVAVIFKPSPLEVHTEVAKWFKDQETFDFLASILHLISTPSMRHYIFAASLRKAKLKDWKNLTIERVCDSELVVVAQYKHDESYQSDRQRAKAFVEAGHGSQATFYRLVKRLPEKVEVPEIRLRDFSVSHHSRKIVPFRKVAI